MKRYSYSVKETITDYFGKENTIASLRNVKLSEDEKFWLPLAWQYADQQVLGNFLEHSKGFLTDTILTDDYIVYVAACEDKYEVYLMFMLTFEEAPFHIDIEYARQITKYWGDKFNCQALIMSVCIGLYSIVRFTSSNSQEYRDRTYKVTKVNGKDILTEVIKSCWSFYYMKLLSVAKSEDIRDYECLFEPDVKITKGTDDDKMELGTGIRELKNFIEIHAPLNLAYKKDDLGGCFIQGLTEGDFWLELYVNQRNLITEVNFETLDKDETELIIDTAPEEYGSLTDKVPALQSIRPLNAEDIYGYGLQLRYADGMIRHYYIALFETRSMPGHCVIDGYRFTQETLRSGRIDENNGVIFDNGYVIPAHILYYHSCPQVKPRKIDTVVYENDMYKIRALYQLPLVQFHGWGTFTRYWGRPEDCFGPAFTDVDDTGKRLSDITYYSSGRGLDMCVEPNFRYGIKNNAGSWAAPPIYSRFEGKIIEGCVKATRGLDGKECLLTKDGNEVDFAYPIDMNLFMAGRCQFSTCQWEGNPPDKGCYWMDDDMIAGNWGFIDTEGKIAVKPQYVYVTGFRESRGMYCIVAKMDANRLLWGVIDRDGTEVVPCKYPSFDSPWDEAVIYQEEEGGLYGVMDFDGTIITEPKFGYINQYDTGRRLVVAGEDDGAMGVYSVDLQKYIVPAKHYYIYLGEDRITGNLRNTEGDVYYDYSGQVIHDGRPDADGADTAESAITGLRWIGFDKQWGVADEKGKELLKPVYTEIGLRGDFIEALQRTEHLWSVRSYLYDYEGRPVINDICRNLRIDDETGYITAETPAGIIKYRIEKV